MGVTYLGECLVRRSLPFPSGGSVGGYRIAISDLARTENAIQLIESEGLAEQVFALEI